MTIQDITAFIPFVSCVTNGKRTPPAATRIAELAVIVAFMWWQMNKLEDKVEALATQINTMQVQISENRTRLNERGMSSGGPR